MSASIEILILLLEPISLLLVYLWSFWLVILSLSQSIKMCHLQVYPDVKISTSSAS